MLQLLSSIFQRKEKLRVQTFIAQLPVEALDESILHRPSWPDELQPHAILIGPDVEGAAAKLAPIDRITRAGTLAVSRSRCGQPNNDLSDRMSRTFWKAECVTGSVIANRCAFNALLLASHGRRTILTLA